MRTRIVRSLAVLATGLLASVVAIPTAGASPNPALNRATSGPFSGTTSYTFATDGCSFVHQTFDATFGARRKRASVLHLSGCVDLAGGFPYSGSFTMGLKRHGSLIGTVTGSVGSDLPCAPLDFTLTVSGGTGRFTRTSGTIALHGTWCSSGNVPALNDPISGTLVGSLTRR